MTDEFDQVILRYDEEDETYSVFVQQTDYEDLTKEEAEAALDNLILQAKNLLKELGDK